MVVGLITATVGDCRLVVVQDALQECPYREGQTARMPLNVLVGRADPGVTDQWLARGYRRSGEFLYRTQCPLCHACEPTRLEVTQFQLSGSLRRVLRRGDRELECHWGRPQVDRPRVAMFNRHRHARGLGRDERQVDAAGYQAFLVDTCCDSRELSIKHRGRLVAVSVIDVGEQSFSAVYTHFEPDAGRYSLGTYAILKQIETARAQQRRWLYLGMYVAENSHLNYKARFTPQQRLIGGEWVAFE